MTILEVREQMPLPTKHSTLCYLLKGGSLLLAMKKRGFGVGKWNGIGGKQDLGERIEDAMVRETQEEIGATPNIFEKAAVLTFYFEGLPKDKDWNQIVHVYLCTQWTREIRETEEMAPKWFKKKELPFDHMWESDKIWLPRVLDGEVITGEFLFDKQQKLGDYAILNGKSEWF